MKRQRAGALQAIRRHPLTLAIAIQLLCGLLLAIWTPFTAPALIWQQGLLAALLSALFGLPRWWWPLQLLLPPLALWVVALQLPPWIFLLLFTLLLLINGNSVRERVPLYLSNRTTWGAVESRLPPQSGVTFIDLGCGVGGLLLYLARRRPDGRFIGVELAPLPFAIAWLRLRLSRLKNVELHFGSIWDQPLNDIDVAYAFLSPVPMDRLITKAGVEMKEHSLFISNSFLPESPAPDETLILNDRRHTRLHLWWLDRRSASDLPNRSL